MSRCIQRPDMDILLYVRRLPRSVLFAMAAGAAIRLFGLIWIYAHGHADATVYGDGIGYVDLAKNLLAGRGFGLDLEGQFIAETFRLPGLPFLLLPFVGWKWGMFMYQLLLSIVAGTMLPWLVWRLGVIRFSEGAGRIAAWLMALEPFMVMFSWLPLSEIPFLLTALTAWYFVEQALVAKERTNSRCFLWLAGLFATASVYIRPGNLPLLVLALGLPLLFARLKKCLNWKVFAIPLICVLVLLVPWGIRTKMVSGVFALSATGWRNVYTDYLASIRAVEHGTMFWDEKAHLKEQANELFGLSRYEINSPAHSAVLRNHALKEIIAHPVTVLKLQSIITFSFFTNDSYLSMLMRLGFVPAIVGRASPSYLVLRDGASAFPAILAEMQRQWFIPVVARVFTVAMLGLALYGLWVLRRHWLAGWVAILVGWSALASSVIGLGVEGRLRMSIAPLLFLLAGAGLRRQDPYED